jgi:hypothetical protein
VTETQVYLSNNFSTQESAIEAALQGQQKIDVGFERGSVVVNGGSAEQG